jgi:hypothetical protein
MTEGQYDEIIIELAPELETGFGPHWMVLQSEIGIGVERCELNLARNFYKVEGSP